MNKYRILNKILAIISLVSLFLQPTYPVILAAEETGAGSGTSCTLSVDRPAVSQGEYVTFTLTAGFYGYSAYWGGSNNGQPIGGNYPLDGWSGNNRWLGTYRQDSLGTFSRFVEILNEEGNVICTTNTVNVTIITSKPTVPSCENKKIADCVRRECDSFIQKMVCIDQWEEENCVVIDKPGVATDERCGIPPGQGATAPTLLSECFRQECDTSINQMVCIDKWDICEPEGCTETERPGRLFGQSCVTSAPPAITQPADTPAEPAPIITYPAAPFCSLEAIPQTIQTGGEITWHIYADPLGISANWIGPDLNQSAKVEGYPEGNLPNWSRPYTYNQPASYTRQAVINYSSAPVCTTNSMTVTITPPSGETAPVEPDINLDFQGITPPVTITSESQQLATINQEVAVTTDQTSPDLPPIVTDPSSQAQAEQQYVGAAFERARENAEFLAEARTSEEGSQGNLAETIGSAASNAGNVGVGAAQAAAGAAGNLLSGIGQLFQPQNQKQAEEAIKKAEGIYVEPSISTGIPDYCSASDFSGTPETNPECYPQQRFERAKETAERAGFEEKEAPQRSYTLANEILERGGSIREVNLGDQAARLWNGFTGALAGIGVAIKNTVAPDEETKKAREVEERVKADLEAEVGNVREQAQQKRLNQFIIALISVSPDEKVKIAQGMGLGADATDADLQTKFSENKGLEAQGDPASGSFVITTKYGGYSSRVLYESPGYYEWSKKEAVGRIEKTGEIVADLGTLGLYSAIKRFPELKNEFLPKVVEACSSAVDTNSKGFLSIMGEYQGSEDICGDPTLCVPVLTGVEKEEAKAVAAQIKANHGCYDSFTDYTELMADAYAGLASATLQAVIDPIVVAGVVVKVTSRGASAAARLAKGGSQAAKEAKALQAVREVKQAEKVAISTAKAKEESLERTFVEDLARDPSAYPDDWIKGTLMNEGGYSEDAAQEAVVRIRAEASKLDAERVTAGGVGAAEVNRFEPTDVADTIAPSAGERAAEAVRAAGQVPGQTAAELAQQEIEEEAQRVLRAIAGVETDRVAREAAERAIFLAETERAERAAGEVAEEAAAGVAATAVEEAIARVGGRGLVPNNPISRAVAWVEDRVDGILGRRPEQEAAGLTRREAAQAIEEAADDATRLVREGRPVEEAVAEAVDGNLGRALDEVVDGEAREAGERVAQAITEQGADAVARVVGEETEKTVAEAGGRLVGVAAARVITPNPVARTMQSVTDSARGVYDSTVGRVFARKSKGIGKEAGEQVARDAREAAEEAVPAEVPQFVASSRVSPGARERLFEDLSDVTTREPGRVIRLGEEELDQITPDNLDSLLQEAKDRIRAQRRAYVQEIENFPDPSEALNSVCMQSSQSHALTCAVNGEETFRALKNRVEKLAKERRIGRNNPDLVYVMEFLDNHIKMNELGIQLFEIDTARRISIAKSEAVYFENALKNYPELTREISRALDEFERVNTQLVKSLLPSGQDELKNQISELRQLLSQQNPNVLREIFYDKIIKDYTDIVFTNFEILNIDRLETTFRSLQEAQGGGIFGLFRRTKPPGTIREPQTVVARVEDFADKTFGGLTRGGGPEQVAQIPPAREPVAQRTVANKARGGGNEDAVLVSYKDGIVAVFDGAGGHESGDVASRIARNTYESVLRELPESPSTQEVLIALRTAHERAVESMGRFAEVNPASREMGTTSTVVKLFKDEEGERIAAILSVGDTRAYGVNKDGSIKQLTQDEGALDGDVTNGRITPRRAREIQERLDKATDVSQLSPEEASYFERRNQTNLLTPDIPSTPVIKMSRVGRNADYIVVVSDGVHDNLTFSQIEAIIKSARSPQEAVDSLVFAARENAGRKLNHRAKDDDITAVAMDVSSPAGGRPQEVLMTPAEALKNPERPVFRGITLAADQTAESRIVRLERKKEEIILRHKEAIERLTQNPELKSLLPNTDERQVKEFIKSILRDIMADEANSDIEDITEDLISDILTSQEVGSRAREYVLRNSDSAPLVNNSTDLPDIKIKEVRGISDLLGGAIEVHLSQEEIASLVQRVREVASYTVAPKDGVFNEMGDIVGSLDIRSASPNTQVGADQRKLIHFLHLANAYPDSYYSKRVQEFLRGGGRAEDLPVLFADLLADQKVKLKQYGEVFNSVVDEYNQKVLPKANEMAQRYNIELPRLDSENIAWLTRDEVNFSCEGVCTIQTELGVPSGQFFAISFTPYGVVEREPDELAALQHALLHESIHANVLHKLGIQAAISTDPITTSFFEELTENLAIYIEREAVGEAANINKYGINRSIGRVFRDILLVPDGTYIMFAFNQDPTGYIKYLDNRLNTLSDEGYKAFVNGLYRRMQIGPAQKELLFGKRAGSIADIREMALIWKGRFGRGGGFFDLEHLKKYPLESMFSFEVPGENLVNPDAAARFFEEKFGLTSKPGYLPSRYYSETLEGVRALQFERDPRVEEALRKAWQELQTRSSARTTGSIGAGKNIFAVFNSVAWAANDNSPQNLFFDQSLLESLVKQKLIQRGFDPAVAQNTDVFAPIFSWLPTGYRLVTGRSGNVSGFIEAGHYTVDVQSMPGFNLSAPASIEAKDGSSVVVPIGIREGSGKIEKLSLLRKDDGLIRRAYAQEETGNEPGKVTVVVFSDKNKNGRLDKNEDILPWAGLKVELKKVNQDRTLPLTAGWNLVALEVLPRKPLNASTLLQEIAKQGGYATTVSVLENGAWKSFVVRGDKTYSGDDFPITLGKAYFVKALKSSVFLYQGQELVAPIKLKLASGWNGVGIPYSQKTYSADQLLDTLSSSKAEADTTGRWESGLWDTFVKQGTESFGENFPIEQARGYLLKVGKGLEFSP